jgi:23S rRNA (uracil1939-C5)-methyltransferase
VAVRGLPSEVLAAFREIEARVSEPPLAVTLQFVARVPGSLPRAARAALGGLPVPYLASVEGEAPQPEAVQRFALPRGVEIEAPPGVFTQVNWPVNVAIVSAVVEGATRRGAARFCDAYAGAGNFALPLAHAGLEGVAVERDGRAVRAAKVAAARQGLGERLVFREGDAGRALADLAREGERIDLVLLDPPRKGAAEAMSGVRRLAPPHVALCSCDPVTLARDVATLQVAGYRLDSVQGFDMFPHTHHLESLAWMSRREAPESE